MTTAAAAAENVHLQVAAGIATITLDSPANRNALSAALRADLSRHLHAADADADAAVRVIVLTHTGPVFCAGADLREARSGDATAPSRALVDLLERIMTSHKPVVARLTSAARAGGIGLVAACDFAIATPTVTFAFSEVRIGVIPSIISVPLKMRVAGSSLHRLFLTGETFDAHHAASLGLLSSVSPPDTLDDDLARLTETLQLASPNALAGAKALVQPSKAELRTEFEQMRELSAQYFALPDAQEGMSAFAQKRPPAWTPDTATRSFVAPAQTGGTGR